MTNAISGSGGKVSISATVTDVSQWSATFNTGVEDATTFDSSGWREEITTIKDFNGAFTTNAFLNKQGKHDMATFQINNSSASATNPYFSCAINITEMSPTVPAEGKVEWSYSFRSTGPVGITVE